MFGDITEEGHSMVEAIPPWEASRDRRRGEAEVTCGS